MRKHIVINGISATAGGGVTYLRNFIYQLSRLDRTNHYTVYVPVNRINDFPGAASNVDIRTSQFACRGLMRRLWWDQVILRWMIKGEKADVLLAIGNFGLWRPPVLEILLNRSSLMFSKEYWTDLRRRNERLNLWRIKISSALARMSIRNAHINVTPTTAFANQIRASGGLDKVEFQTIPHGFDEEFFIRLEDDLPTELLAQLRINQPIKRILLASPYNYFRNFETFIRAMPIIKERLGEPVLFVLTAEIESGKKYGGYDATYASDLIDKLGVRSDIAMLGSLDYRYMYQIYRCCDLLVLPSYAESFGHPLVEAMCSGLPIVASDIASAREVCGGAALHFPTFDASALAERCVRVLKDSDLASKLVQLGRKRYSEFSWEEHVRAILTLCGISLTDEPIVGGSVHDHLYKFA